MVLQKAKFRRGGFAVPDYKHRKYCRSRRGKPGRAALLELVGILAVNRAF
jgi:hypothetical protein